MGQGEQLNSILLRHLHEVPPSPEVKGGEESWEVGV